MGHIKFQKNLSYTTRFVLCLLISFMLYNLFINIFLDSLINGYQSKSRLYKNQIVLYSVVFFVSLLGILLFILSLNLLKRSNHLCNLIILASNLIYVALLVLQFFCFFNRLFFKYWTEKWITIMNFAANLVIALCSILVNLFILLKS